jgi:hypothetical protein
VPEPGKILEGIAAIVNGRTNLAILWHVVLAAVVIAILAGWRPLRRTGAVAAALPLLSVALMAKAAGNPFNAIVFLLFAILLVVLGLRLPLERVVPAPVGVRVAGALMIAFGWVYPHFLEGGSWLIYLYAAPTGLIPCPTLSVMVGLTFLAAGFSSKPFALTLGFLGLFYGAFGAFRLGVTIDLVLLAGSVALMAFALTLGRPARRPA